MDLDAALDIVKADLAATGPAGPLRLVSPDWAEPPSAFVEFRGAYGTGMTPADARDALTALLTVADQARDSVMDLLQLVWPVCPSHRLGVHPAVHDATAVWW